VLHQEGTHHRCSVLRRNTFLTRIGGRGELLYRSFKGRTVAFCGVKLYICQFRWCSLQPTSLGSYPNAHLVCRQRGSWSWVGRTHTAFTPASLCTAVKFTILNSCRASMLLEDLMKQVRGRFVSCILYEIFQWVFSRC